MVRLLKVKTSFSHHHNEKMVMRASSNSERKCGIGFCSSTDREIKEQRLGRMNNECMDDCRLTDGPRVVHEFYKFC